MTSYQSEVKTISSSEEVVFGILSDLKNLEQIQEIKELQGKISNPEFDTNEFTFQAEMFGRIGFKIIEKTPCNTIKFESMQLPFVMNAWIQLKEIASNDTRMKLTLKADFPAMIKMMIGSKLQEGIDKLADKLADALNRKLN